MIYSALPLLLLSFAEPASAKAINVKRAGNTRIISASFTDRVTNGFLGSINDTTIINAGVQVWLSGRGTHTLSGNIENAGSLIVSQTDSDTYLRNPPSPPSSQKVPWSGATAANGNLINTGSILLNDLGAVGSPAYIWRINSLENAVGARMQWCGKGDKGVSQMQLTMKESSVNNGLLIYEQTPGNIITASQFSLLRNLSPSTSNTTTTVTNNGGVLLRNIRLDLIQNIQGTGCFMIGDRSSLFLTPGVATISYPTPGFALAGQSISFIGQGSVLHIEASVYLSASKSTFGATVYGFGQGNAFEFADQISRFSYDGVYLQTRFPSGRVFSINIGPGYSADLFSMGPSIYDSTRNAIFYSGAAPVASVPAQCLLTAPLCTPLISDLSVTSSSTGQADMTSTLVFAPTTTTTMEIMTTLSSSSAVSDAPSSMSEASVVSLSLATTVMSVATPSAPDVSVTSIGTSGIFDVLATTTTPVANAVTSTSLEATIALSSTSETFTSTNPFSDSVITSNTPESLATLSSEASSASATTALVSDTITISSLEQVVVSTTLAAATVMTALVSDAFTSSSVEQVAASTTQVATTTTTDLVSDTSTTSSVEQVSASATQAATTAMTGVVSDTFITSSVEQVSASATQAATTFTTSASESSLPSLACYHDEAESGAPRTLNGPRFTDRGGMTNEVCAAFCTRQGFAISGTEYGIECYCGSVLPSTDLATCQKRCSGNSQSICGGDWALSVSVNKSLLASSASSASASASTSIGTRDIASMSTLATMTTTGAVSATATPTRSLFKYNGQAVGCFADAAETGAARTFAGPSYQDSFGLTNEKCATYCGDRAFAYAATEYGQECYCSNTLPTVTSARCTVKCSGNAAETCGGSWALSVTVNQDILDARSNGLPSSTAYNEVGCFADSVSLRTFSGFSYKNDSMTPALCAAKCSSLSFSFSGTEFGNECYCSNTAPITTSNQCVKACAGNSGLICGGPNALTVYQDPAVPASSAPTCTGLPVGYVACTEGQKVSGGKCVAA